MKRETFAGFTVTEMNRVLPKVLAAMSLAPKDPVYTDDAGNLCGYEEASIRWLPDPADCKAAIALNMHKFNPTLVHKAWLAAIDAGQRGRQHPLFPIEAEFIEQTKMKFCFAPTSLIYGPLFGGSGLSPGLA